MMKQQRSLRRAASASQGTIASRPAILSRIIPGHAPGLVALFLWAASFGQHVLAATDPEPNISRWASETQPFRAVYSLSAVAIEVVVSATEVHHLKGRMFSPPKEKGTSALPAGWAQRVSEALPPALAGAAARADIALVSGNEIPACPDDRNATFGRLSVEILDIEASYVSENGPTPNVWMQTQLRLTDNCDREIKSVGYQMMISQFQPAAVDEILERWLTQYEPAEVLTSAGYTRVLPSNVSLAADAMIARGLLVWMPTWPAKDAAPRSTPYTLRALSPAGTLSIFYREKNSTPVLDQDLTLHWESLEELLAALGPAELLSRISDIRYELIVYRMQQASARERASAVPISARRIQVFHSADLTGTEWSGSAMLEPCQWYAWSFRAHFRLDGFPRMTAWSALDNGPGDSQLVLPSGVHQFRTPPPAGFKDCR